MYELIRVGFLIFDTLSPCALPFVYMMNPSRQLCTMIGDNPQQHPRGTL